MLNREPMGMKPNSRANLLPHFFVSVLNREPMGMKLHLAHLTRGDGAVSVLNREPMGMKQPGELVVLAARPGFSAQPRADGDEAGCGLMDSPIPSRFSAQPRADGDEARPRRAPRPSGQAFQCSTASRWG